MKYDYIEVIMASLQIISDFADKCRLMRAK